MAHLVGYGAQMAWRLAYSGLSRRRGLALSGLGRFYAQRASGLSNEGRPFSFMLALRSSNSCPRIPPLEALRYVAPGEME